MKKRFLVFFLFWNILTPAKSQEKSLINSIFWQVSGNGLSNPSYLFGTHHLYDYKFIEKNEKIINALKSADYVMGEIVIDSNELAMAMKLTMAMMMKDNTLSNLMKKEDYEATDKCLREYMGIGIGFVNNFKPIFIYHLLMVAKYQKATTQAGNDKNPQMLGGNPLDNSMDGYFQQQARLMKKKVKGLETVDAQLKMLYEGYTLERQVEMLLEMVYDKGGNSSNDVAELSKLYVKQDLSELLNIMQKSSREDELNSLLMERNNKWIPQIDELLKSGKSAFIAVGAGHLPGDFGVIYLLRKKGYTLNPVTITVE